MEPIINLYRGDSIENKFTNPGNCRSEGIRSAAFGAGGNPLNIENKTPLISIKEHIDHLTKPEIAYYEITDFISFTEDEETAKFWASDRQPDTFRSCSVPYMETRYVFHCQITTSDLIQLSNGIWELRYQCNPNLKTCSSSDNQLITAMLRSNGCAICKSNFKNHSLILIKPALFFNHLSENKKFKRAHTLAVKNDEWLLLPNDLDNQGFRTTRIQPADFWDFKGYIKTDEPIRTINSFQLK